MLPIKTFLAALKFVMHAQGDKDIRYYLNGVLFEFRAPDKLRLVATNGHQMAVIELNVMNGFDGEYIVDSQCLKILFETFKRSAGDVTFYPIDGGKFGMLTNETDNYTPKLIDGKFPEWRRVAATMPPPDTVPSIVGFDAARMAAAYAAFAGFLKSNKIPAVAVKTYGTRDSLRIDATGIPYGEVVEAFAIVMPCKL